nr:hypothetical protein [Tanacetum cinerariifolium]
TFRWWKFQPLAKETLAESRKCLKFGNGNIIRRGHILNAMSDPFFDVYQNYPTARELWKPLKERFFTEDATRRLNRHTSSPDKEHWDYGLDYIGDPSVLEGYTDASWITNQEDYVSMSQEFVALASCYKEAE